MRARCSPVQVKRPSGLQVHDLAGANSPGAGSPATRSRSITAAAGGGGGHTSPGASGAAMSSASAAAAAAAVFISKLKRPGRNGGGGRTRDLAGILRGRTQGNQVGLGSSQRGCDRLPKRTFAMYRSPSLFLVHTYTDTHHTHTCTCATLHTGVV